MPPGHTRRGVQLLWMRGEYPHYLHYRTRIAAATGGREASSRWPPVGVTRCNLHLKARFGPWYCSQSAVRTLLERYVVRPPRLEVQVPDPALRRPIACARFGG